MRPSNTARRAVLSFVIAVSVLSTTMVAEALPHFLTSPFNDSGVVLRQGWLYDSPGELCGPETPPEDSPFCHYAIDYRKVGTAGTPVPFQVIAAADGTATYHPIPTSCVDPRDCSWGNHVIIQHTLIDGTDYFTVSAHLASSPLPPNTPVPIKRGDPIGTAGMTGLAGGLIHLHFEVHSPEVITGHGIANRLDPYDVYGNMFDYPPTGTCGSEFLWTQCPPSPFTWVVPNNVTSVTVDARGAQGGGGTDLCGTERCASELGGKGGRVQTTLAVTPGETLVIYVGGRGGDLIPPNTGGPGGFNGGGAGGIDNVDFNAPAGGGGGASDVRQGGDNLAHRVVVAGGGGGAECCQDAPGGDGGGLTGMSGGTSGGGSNPGGGGTQSNGGAGGSGCNGSGSSGSLGQGGLGGNGDRAGGGGGGGYYGGGGGGGCTFGSGGGGGSSYSAGTDTIHTQGYQTGDGQVIIIVP